MRPELDQLLADARQRQKYAVARLISVFEDNRPEAAQRRRYVLDQLGNSDKQSRGTFIGITGTPGAGKSSLIGALATRLLDQTDAQAIGVLAVDPTSQESGGSLLGDRTRVQFAHDEPRLFFRSQASDLDLGGLSRRTFQVCRLLRHLFDYIFIETVGIGQSETDIRLLADRTYLVLQPLGGDHVQFMKAGIMEIPDVFVINKADQSEAAAQSYHMLRSTLGLARPDDPDPDLPIFRTSTIDGQGLDELTTDIAASCTHADRTFREREAHFFAKWIRAEFGRDGLEHLDELGGAAPFLTRHTDFDAASDRFRALAAGRWNTVGEIE